MSFPEQKHEVFRRDPTELMQYVNQQVAITTIDGIIHNGWIYTVDPVSSAFILLKYTDPDIVTDGAERLHASHAELILGHAVRSVELVRENDSESHQMDMDTMFKPVSNVALMDVEEMAACCERLRLWLVENRVPVERATGRPHILTIGGDVLTIEPPYSAESCSSTNGIILSRVQSLIQRMPHIE